MRNRASNERPDAFAAITAPAGLRATARLASPALGEAKRDRRCCGAAGVRIGVQVRPATVAAVSHSLLAGAMSSVRAAPGENRLPSPPRRPNVSVRCERFLDQIRRLRAATM